VADVSGLLIVDDNADLVVAMVVENAGHEVRKEPTDPREVEQLLGEFASKVSPRVVRPAGVRITMW
jgi:hypothetical protein